MAPLGNGRFQVQRLFLLIGNLFFCYAFIASALSSLCIIVAALFFWPERAWDK